MKQHPDDFEPFLETEKESFQHVWTWKIFYTVVFGPNES